jgi:hypothetical protein
MDGKVSEHELADYMKSTDPAHALFKSRHCDNPPRKIPYYRLNQSTLDIKR